MKRKRIFLIGLTILMLLAPASMVFVTVGQQRSYVKKVAGNINYDKLQLLSMAVESKTDPEYQPIQYSSQVDDKGKKALNQVMSQLFDAVLDSEQWDSGFYYTAVNQKTHQTYKNQHSDYRVCYKGVIEQGKNSKNVTYSDFNIVSILKKNKLKAFIEASYKFVSNAEGKPILNINDKVKIDLDQVTINPPNSIKMNYYYTISNSFMTDYQSVFNDDYFVVVLSASAVLLGLIFFIYILMNPLAVEETVNPYRTVKQWKLLTVLLTVGVACALFMAASVLIGGYTFVGTIPATLRHIGIGYSDILSYLAYFVCVLIFYFLFSILCFMVKYIFMNGFDYLKNNTVIYALIKKIKHFGDNIMAFDLKDDYNMTIAKLTLSNTLLVIILYELSPSNTVFAVVYIFFSFLYIRKQLYKIKNDYKNMLNFTDQLSHGHFETEIQDDLGIFNSMRDRLNNLKQGFETAVREETKSQDMKTELITNVSHDLKTPLTCIKNYVILLKNADCDEKTRREYLQQLETYTNRLADLIQDLFDVSKASSGNIELHPIDLRLTALLDQSIAECIEILESKDIQIVKNVEDVTVYLDGDKTYRIFENLLTNIGKYAMPHSRAYIDIHEEENDILVIFKNMSEVEMNFSSEEIQERFVRGDKSRHETGSGLGLAIAKSFVAAQGGTFNIAIDGDLFKVIMTFKKNKSVK